MRLRHVGKPKFVFLRTHGVVRRVTVKSVTTDCLQASTSSLFAWADRQRMPVASFAVWVPGAAAAGTFNL